MEVWVLTKRSRFEGLQARRFEEEAEVQNIVLRHVCAQNFEIVEPWVKKGKIFYKGRYVKVPDVLITRLVGMSHFSFSLVRLLENMGVIVINTADSIEIADDKMKTIHTLTSRGFKIPRSVLTKFPVDYEYVSKLLGFPIVMKTALGAKGEGVLLLENLSQFKDTLSVIKKSSVSNPSLIFQHYVSNSYGRDVRVFVIGDKAVGAVLRQGGEGQFKSNVSLGGRAEFYEMDDNLAKLAVEASKALGLNISGVDFLIDKENFLIAEVNATPAFVSFENIAKVNVVEEMLNYASSLHRNRK